MRLHVLLIASGRRFCVSEVGDIPAPPSAFSCALPWPASAVGTALGPRSPLRPVFSPSLPRHRGPGSSWLLVLCDGECPH